MSAREEIFAAIDALMEGLGGFASYEAEPSGDPDAFPAGALYDGGQEPLENESGASRYELTFTLEGYVEGHTGAAARAARNTLHANCVKALLQDPTLGGLVELIEETGRMRVDVAELANKRRLGFAQDFIVQFSTPRGDPTVLS